MTDFHEQQVSVKSCVKLGKTFTETLEMLKHAFGNESMGRTQTYYLYKRFKDGQISIEDDPRSGRPSTSTDDQHVTQVCSVIRSNRCLTVREQAEVCDISLGSCHNILTEKWGMHRVAISQELLDQANSAENI
jgi:hypothetical protein